MPLTPSKRSSKSPARPMPAVSPRVAEDARRYLVGGVNSPVRAFRQVNAEPLMLIQGQGAEVVGAGGERFVDFIMGWGALVLGHNPPEVMRALKQAMADGILMGLTHPGEVELARLIADAVPSVEQVRFTTSGTEACLTAVKLARAHTRRGRIVMFDGCYHGHSESLMARKTAGLVEALEQETISIPYHDRGAFATLMQRHGHDIAAVIVEPVAANMGVVVPDAEYLARMRELTAHHGALLIFDEVVTGFRVGYGGAQGLFGVDPDLTIFGKIIGGGLPIGAVGGSSRLMQRLAPSGEVYHGGTFAGHPLSMAAGIATLKALAAHPPYDGLDQLARRFADGLLLVAAQANVPLCVNSCGSMATVFFASTPVKNYAQATLSHREQFAQWANGLRARGILVPPSPLEALFISTAHTTQHVERVIEASRQVFASFKQ